VLLSTYTVITTADDGPGSLRQAILDANASPGADAVHFAIPGEPAAVHTLRPLSPLPAVTGPTTLDATTQPGYAGSPLIELDGSAAGAEVDGVTVLVRPSVIRGLAVNRFSRHGVVVRQTDGSRDERTHPFTLLERCHIGTNPAGTAARPNGGAGVLVDGPGTAIAATRTGWENVISGNTLAGIRVVGGDPRGYPAYFSVVIGGNRIGTNAAGDAPLGNGEEGVLVESPGMRVAITPHVAPARGSNVISGNGASGVRVVGPAGSDNYRFPNHVRVDSTLIGTDGSGARAIPNGQSPDAAWRDGITVTGGGSFDIGSNTISGNHGNGVALLGDPDGGMTVSATGNRIGTDAAGTAALGNGGHGFLAGRVNALELLSNHVSANGGSGVVVRDTFNLSRYTRIQATLSGNRIGTNKAGTIPMGNAGNGIELINAANVTVGGPNPLVSRVIYPYEVGFPRVIPPGTVQNLISANGGHGLYVASSGTAARPSNIRIINNLIGSAISEQATFGNGGSGVYLAGVVGATVGGTHTVAPPGPFTGTHAVGNVISGNAGDGITIASLGTTPSRQNIVERNTIGRLPRAPEGRFGNAGWGIAIVNSSDNRVGGPAAAVQNSIAYNGRGGVLVRSDGAAANQNRLSANSIFANQGPAIDLQPGAGATPNDHRDLDEGANHLQNYPTITGVERAGETTNVRFRLQVPSRGFRVELFASSSPDATAHGEGERFLGAAVVTTGPAGDVTGTISVPSSAIPPRSWLTVTATDTFGNTSEFSPAVSAATARPVYRPPDRAPARLVTAQAAGSVVYEPARRDPLTPRELLA
jgi:hypothetical protein